VYELRTQPEIVQYYHAASGFSTKPTWLAAIKNNHYASWTGLTYEGVSKYFPESEETHKGHGRKLKSGQRSTTKKKPKEDTLPDPEETVPQSAVIIKVKEDNDTNFEQKEEQQAYRKEGCIMVKEVQVDVDKYNRVKIIYTNGTGRFPKTSQTGMNYALVLAEIDSGAILAEAMRDRSAREMVQAYKALIDRLHKSGIFPKKQVLDNEISQAYKDAIAEYEIEYKLFPPHDHRRNIAEKAIHIFKNHFVSILCVC
jgi:hypothetical protein